MLTPDTKPRKMFLNRRRFIRSVCYGLPLLGIADASVFEPIWIRVRRIRLKDHPTVRLVHISDLHHRGNTRFLGQIIRTINNLNPDLACFTGDIVEESTYLNQALSGLKNIKAPLFGVPGNHDYWADVNFDLVQETFAATGGQWLMDQQVNFKDSFVMVGATCGKPLAYTPVQGRSPILLFHYPDWATRLAGQSFRLMLAGHSHGGQVRIPFYGSILTPMGVGQYPCGLYRTAVGPLYVNSGLGWFYLRIRFFCRPEVTLFEL